MDGNENDTNHDNDCSSFALAVGAKSVDPGDSAKLVGTATLQNRSLLVAVRCRGGVACSDTAKLSARVRGKRVTIGTRRFEVGAGESTTLEFELERKVKRKLRKASYVRVDLAEGDDAKLELER